MSNLNIKMDFPTCYRNPGVYSPKEGDEVVGSYEFTRSVAELPVQVFTPRYSEYTIRSKNASILVLSHEFYLDEPRQSEESDISQEQRLSYEEVTLAAHLASILFGSATFIEEEEENIFDSFDTQSDCSSVCSHDDDESRSIMRDDSALFEFPPPDLMISKGMSLSEARFAAKMQEDMPAIGKAVSLSERKFAVSQRFNKMISNRMSITMDGGRASLCGSNSRLSIDISRLSVASMQDSSRMSTPNFDFAQILNDSIAPSQEKEEDEKEEEEAHNDSESERSDSDSEAPDDDFEVTSDISDTDADTISSVSEQAESTIESVSSSPIVKMSSLYSQLKARRKGSSRSLSTISSVRGRNRTTAHTIARSRTFAIQSVLTKTARTGLSYCVRSRSESTVSR